MDILENVEVRGDSGLIGGAIVLSVAAVVIFKFAYPTIETAIASISDETHKTLAELALLGLVLVVVFGALRMAGVV